MDYSKWLVLAVLGLLLRIWIINKVSEGDNIFEGKFSAFTDLDYKVFLDASLFDSPYQRHTYRYSPVLAWIMSPSYKYDQNFGKYLLAFFDMAACFFIFKIFAERKGGDNVSGAILISSIIYTNPFLIYLSTRGSCEAITMTLAFAFLYFYFGGQAHGNMTAEDRQKKGIVDLQPNKFKRYTAYVIYGLWVHFRVFPIILLPMLIMYEFYSVKQNRYRHLFKYLLEFGLISGGVFVSLSVYFYTLYGYQFLHETYIYHLTRRDNRHSRSVVFYDLYLNYFSDAMFKPMYRVILRNLPTQLYLGFFSFYLIKKRSLFFCQGFLIFYFVLFNRVITDQYYIWVFSFLYLIVAEIQAFKDRRWGRVLWLAYRPMAICLVPVGFWIFFKLKLESASKDYTIIHFWMWNVFALFMQVVFITGGVLDMLVEKPQAKPIEANSAKEKVKAVNAKHD